MQGLVLGAGSGIGQAMVLEAWKRPPEREEGWLLSTRRGEALSVLEAQAGTRQLAWKAANALEAPGPWLENLDAGDWRPRLVLVAWGRLVPGGAGDEDELELMREVNGPATLRWVEALCQWLKPVSAAPGGLPLAMGSPVAHIAVLGSVAGDRPRRLQWEYSLSKQELERGLNDLRRRHPHVRIVLVKPGPVATPMTAHMKPGPLMAHPAQVAPRLWRAWEEGWPQVYAPVWWGWISRILSLVPEKLWERFPF
jgi:NAD(P)-dependent dehydrogenase (short-subunit alcohol dehydrogenase family)